MEARVAELEELLRECKAKLRADDWMEIDAIETKIDKALAG